MAHSILYIINIIINEILKEMSPSQPKKIEKGGGKIGDPGHDQQRYDLLCMIASDRSPFMTVPERFRSFYERFR
jgi:hypothetical protein